MIFSHDSRSTEGTQTVPSGTVRDNPVRGVWVLNTAIDTAIWRSRRGPRGKIVLCWRTRGKPTSISNHIINTYPPSMSYLALSTSSFQSTERISQGAVSSESQQQRYVSSSSYTYQRVNKHGPRATVHIRHRSTSLTITRYSTSFISIAHFF
jgi:hypothetical protein